MLDFAQCERLVSQARDKRSKPYANNTRVEKRDEDTYALRLHATDIATFHRNGPTTINSGGWRTVTTKDRLGSVTTHLSSERGVWYVDAEPDSSDPRPPRGRRTVLKPFHALDPGPEPVKPDEGCVAGEIHAVPYEEEKLVGRHDGVSEDEIVRPYDSDSDYFIGYRIQRGTDYTYFGEPTYSHGTDYDAKLRAEYELGSGDRTHYKQCPHCELFDAQHRAWKFAMNGEGWGRNRTHGYKAMVENLERYGSREAWQEAYIADFREARSERAAYKEWVERNRVLFEDGMEINADGYAPRPDPKLLERTKRDERRIARQKKQINKYVNAAVKALVTDGLPMPSSGDCWYCSMHTNVGTDGQRVTPGTGVTWGDMSDADHLKEHMRERYYVPSMFTNALREAGYQPAGIYMLLAMDPDNNRMGGPQEGFRSVEADTVTRDLRRYLYKRLIPEYGANKIPPMVGNVK